MSTRKYINKDKEDLGAKKEASTENELTHLTDEEKEKLQNSAHAVKEMMEVLDRMNGK